MAAALMHSASVAVCHTCLLRLERFGDGFERRFRHGPLSRCRIILKEEDAARSAGNSELVRSAHGFR
jgi:hypothetical protein